MAAKPESRFAAWVRDGLKRIGCDVERIENRVNLGIPDMLVGVGSQWAMVELKVVAAGKKVRLRPHQIAFMIRHTAKGRRCFILVKHERDSMVYLYHGSAALVLEENGLAAAAIKSWPTRAMQWDELGFTLLG